MRKSLFSAAIIICAVLPASTQILKGVVVENEKGGQPVAGVEISAHGATLQRTGIDGQFTLQFPNMHPGETVHLAVKKEGYGLVNYFELSSRDLPKHPEERILEIIICKKASCKTMIGRYIQSSFPSQYAELAGGQTATQEQRTPVAISRPERNPVANAKGRLSEEVARAKSGGTSEVYAIALQFFLKDRIEDALKTLDEGRLQQDLTQARQKVHMAEMEVEKASQSWILKARLLTIQYKFNDAERAFELAVEAAPNSFSAHFALANFNKELNRYSRARKSYQRCLELAKQDTDQAALADTLYNLADLNQTQNLISDALSAYQGALDIYLELEKKDPNKYLPKIALSWSYVGLMQYTAGQTDDAQKSYNEALKIFRNLARENPDYLINIATMLHSLGNLPNNQERLEYAQQTYEDALKRYRELALRKPEYYTGYVLTTLVYSGSLAYEQDRIYDAHQAFEEVVNECADLRKNRTEDCFRWVAIAKLNLGYLDKEENHLDDALKVSQEALQVIQDLADKNPEAHREFIAETQNLIGNIYHNEGKVQEARVAYSRALNLYDELSQKNPDTPLEGMAITLYNRALLNMDQHSVNDARQDFERALNIYTELAARNPHSYRPEMADTLIQLGDLYKAQNMVDESRTAYEKALDIFNVFVLQDPQQFRAKAQNVKDLLDDLKKTSGP